MKADFPTAEAYGHAAWFLMCEPAALRAVAQVEAGPDGGFNDDGTPVVLFERHKFDRHTDGRYRGTRLPGFKRPPEGPDWTIISDPRWGGYGPKRVQHVKLDFAAQLDRRAALMSASWGLFQILGENYSAAGFDTLQAFVNAMIRDVDGHLRALTMLIRNNRELLTSLRSRDWAVFAYNFNGPLFRQNAWHTKMAAAYQVLAKERAA